MKVFFCAIILAVLHTTTFDVSKLPPINSNVKATSIVNLSLVKLKLYQYTLQKLKKL